MSNGKRILGTPHPIIERKPTPPREVRSISFKKRKSRPQYAQEAIDYTTDEAETGVKWADGNVIYKKVVDIGNLPNATSKNVAHGIANIHNLAIIRGVATDGSSYLPMPYTTTTSQINIYATGTNIVVVTETDRSGFTGYVILEYTKS